ncbi:SCO2322 family protein [Luteipulveratus sp. YIM 133132]|uniref:SCO2322 family protein n=1 Tax=Luteipulveratus flavus TaxID=3031728 RepID=A0ABT6C683_9MICO|nr:MULTISPECIES: SCO2322 family protein [unclassified Luteipulveratus]MDE9366430.1 SCO2322 family protein [Luteipulveratus sp. YIM 133132]MDF8264295.1 SCO2322 family protein [Luteipulveratus sp. YIM 133296]
MKTARSGRVMLLVSLVAALTLSGLAAAPSASAATYRFWGYFQLKGTSWSFAQKGPADTKPADGSVEGWRWAVAGETDSRAPRGTVTFEKACAGIPAKPGTKRVAVVLDYGRAADAESGTPPKPAARCTQVPAAATGADVLAAVSSVRTDKSLVCGVDGWPASGCGGPVQNVSAAAKATDDTVAIPVAAQEKSDDSGTRTTVFVVAGIAVLLLIGALVTVARRRRTGTA